MSSHSLNGRNVHVYPLFIFWSRMAFLAFLLLTLLMTGCSLQRVAVNQTAGVLATGKVALEQESDLHFAGEALPATLKTMETFLAGSPENADLLELLAQGFFTYAFAILETEFEKAQLDGSEEARLETLNRRAVLHFIRGRDYGLRLLANPELRDSALSLDVKEVRRRLGELDRESVPALFWSANCWAQAANLAQDDPDTVAALPVIEAFMERVIELEDDYYNAGAHMFFGVYFSSRPVMFGGNPERSKKHFDIALERHGESNLLISYMMAKYYAVQAQDRVLFDGLIKRVLETDVTKYPSLRLSNEIARERARFWLEHVDELFFE